MWIVRCWVRRELGVVTVKNFFFLAFSFFWGGMDDNSLWKTEGDIMVKEYSLQRSLWMDATIQVNCPGTQTVKMHEKNVSNSKFWSQKWDIGHTLRDLGEDCIVQIGNACLKTPQKTWDGSGRRGISSLGFRTGLIGTNTCLPGICSARKSPGSGVACSLAGFRFRVAVEKKKKGMLRVRILEWTRFKKVYAHMPLFSFPKCLLGRPGWYGEM